MKLRQIIKYFIPDYAFHHTIFGFIIIFLLLILTSCTGGSNTGTREGSSSSQENSTKPAAPAETPTPEPGNNGVLITMAMPDNSAIAVLAGPTDYPGGSYDLDYPANDAIDLKDSLVNSNLWNGANIFFENDIHVTKEKIHTAIINAKNNINNNGLFIFLYSGHGSNLGKTGYLVPYDGINSSSERISQTELKAWLLEFPVSVKKVVFIDSCYSGLFIGQKAFKTPAGKIKFAALPGSDPSFEGDFVENLTGVSNLVCISASAGGELAQESSILQNGVFTYYIVEGLSYGEAIGPADFNNSNDISIEEVHSYTAPRASAFNPGQNAKIGDSNNARTQIIKN